PSTYVRTDSITIRTGASTLLGLFLVRFEKDRCKRRQGQRQGVAVLLVRHRHRVRAAIVAQSAAAVNRGVAVEDLAPVAAARQADAVVQARHRGEVEHSEDRRRTLLAQSQERQRALLPVAALHPAEP